ncbi:MAG TPA: class I SAM-dependent methyltransferase [Oculatellaceae cyanobacterium]|jgi:2-polyprenyl-3-methyl-5-hydroxy-6-metoxy-1,4-benzoquinol methylase
MNTGTQSMLTDTVLKSVLAPIKCPVCGSICSDPPLYHYTAAEAAAHFCPSTRNADRNQRLEKCINKLWEGNDCTIHRCSDCGFAFGNPFVGGDEEFYSILHEQKDYPGWRWDYDMALKEALGAFTGGKILEIGAGAGVFLRHLGKEWQCYAMEGSEITRKNLEATGIKVFRNFSEVPPSEVGTFQVVSLFQVLEHIADFRTVLSEGYQLLADGGRLFLTVPDGEAMIRQEKLTGCADMPPNHLLKWTPDSLARALRDAGFEPSQATYEPASLKNLKDSLHLRMISDATNERSLAAQVYRISNKPIRAGLLAGLAVPALLRMFPYISQLTQGGSFAMVGVKKQLTINN